MSEEFNAQAVEQVVSDARLELRVKRDRDRARELVVSADAMLEGMQGPASTRADVLASMSSLWLDLGDERRSEQLVVQSIAVEADVTPARPVILGTRKLFYAKRLHAQGRFGEAARAASEGLAIYAQGVEPDHPELGRLRADLAPIFRDAGSLAQNLRQIAERLCAVATGDEAEIRRALAIPTSPPPLGALTCEVTGGELSRASVELGFAPDTLTRRELDATFGAANVLPRTGPRASHTLGYELRVAGAPARISLYARFAERPEPETSAKSVLLRIDRA